MKVEITEELVNRYIDGYFKKRYPIHPDFSNFWDLVETCVIDENAKLEITYDRQGYFIKYRIGSIDHYTCECPTAKTTEDFIRYVAGEVRNAIIKYESIEISGLTLLILEERIKKLEEKFSKLVKNT